LISNSIVSRLNIRINEAAIQTNNMTGKKVEKSADFEASSGPFNTKLSCCICSKIELVASEQIAKTANAFRLLRTVFQIFFFATPPLYLLLYQFSDAICIALALTTPFDAHISLQQFPSQPC